MSMGVKRAVFTLVVVLLSARVLLLKRPKWSYVSKVVLLY